MSYVRATRAASRRAAPTFLVRRIRVALCRVALRRVASPRPASRRFPGLSADGPSVRASVEFALCRSCDPSLSLPSFLLRSVSHRCCCCCIVPPAADSGFSCGIFTRRARTSALLCALRVTTLSRDHVTSVRETESREPNRH